MLISHRHRFIYTKTAKTGGTSVESYFEPCCMPEGTWTPSHARDEYVCDAGVIGFRGAQRPPGVVWWNHMPARRIRELVGPAVWQDYLKFCVVRNPFERAVSQFFFTRPPPAPDAPAVDPAPADFEGWLLASGMPNDRAAYVIDGAPCLDVYLRHEQLEADLQRLCERLRLPWEPSRLPRLKAGLRPPWATVQRLYTPRARDFVEQACAFELQTFGYRFPSPRETGTDRSA